MTEDSEPRSEADDPPASEAPIVAFEVVTLFPEVLDGFLGASLLGKAIRAGLVAVHRTSPRDYAPGRHRSVDDAPYGGGPGMILRVEPLAAAVDAIVAARGPAHRVLLTPQGRLFDQRMARDLAARPRILLVCGRYEGVDERAATLLADDEIAIGDYVLSGGELAAAVMMEAVSRLVPGVLGSEQSSLDESFSAGRLEYPQWTRPRAFRGLTVPEVLQSGDHQAVERWRRRESLRRTIARRPDLLAHFPLTAEERALLGPEPDRPPSRTS